MYIRSTVETEAQSRQEFAQFQRLPAAGSTVLDSQCKFCVWPSYADRLSLKCTFRGLETYYLRQRPVTVAPEQLLIVNAGQPYASAIRSEEWVHSFAIYFDPQLVADVAAAHRASDELLLATPWAAATPEVWFFEQLHAAPPALRQRLRGLQQALAQRPFTALELEEQLHAVLSAVLGLHQRHLARSAERLAAVKRSTRLEICRRLYVAKEFIDEAPAEVLTLEDIARAGMLSKNHLLRHFRQLFGLSPHEYATGLRLARARTLLTESALPVQVISAQVGFASPSAFGRLFKAALQLTPQQYRQQHAA
ncbi:AraC family transcriptional regulator [Hymenobacter sp. 15J16-1T3B]|uniref:AraC family transcriptional regulator n=1 Tax=Hymenobacter sp. 15J16-1T3B TaxID=2886941 RepID=UPI001D11D251|nr:AraC family transcriptional regulator [Hymenobacter sp. 15J16-1T3B]MCC3156557.1 AraC family transcriptional regulator [Hymenobacter sp. 15J16-1T3B]